MGQHTTRLVMWGSHAYVFYLMLLYHVPVEEVNPTSAQPIDDIISHSSPHRISLLLGGTVVAESAAAIVGVILLYPPIGMAQ